MTTSREEETSLLVALGGNAIARADDDGSIASQYRRAYEALVDVAELALTGVSLVLTHGNGPVVGNIVLRGELASDEIPTMPLYIAGADSEGGIGLVLQQTLGNLLRAAGCDRPVAAIVTQVVVDAEDTAFATPTKPIGPYYTTEQAKALTSAPGWTMKRESDRGWRRLVASPHPVRVIETEAIATLVRAGVITIAAGGGGVPVTCGANGRLTGIDAVIDKDRTSVELALALGVSRLAILMESDAVYRDWHTADERRIECLTATEAAEFAARDDGAAGSIGPKLESAARFVRMSGHDAVICGSGSLASALRGESGTRIVPDA